MQPDTRAYLFDMQQAVLGIQMFLAGKTLDDLMADLMLRLAVEREFQILGEALSRLSKADPSTAQQIPDHQAIVGFRNVIVHGYDKINYVTMWRVIERDLPLLRDLLQRLLTP